jgi:hypothetical protein
MNIIFASGSLGCSNSKKGIVREATVREDRVEERLTEKLDVSFFVINNALISSHNDDVSVSEANAAKGGSRVLKDK